MRLRTKSLLVTVLALMIALTISAAALADNDYANHWSARFINDAYSRGWMTGDGNGNFRPDAPISRGEFAVMLWRAMDKPQPSYACTFTDVPRDSFYYQAVAALFEAGVVSGYDTTTFAPAATLTREMGFTMLARAFKLTPANGQSFTNFSDHQQISSWAQASVSALLERGFISGVGNNQAAPKTQLKRGELAKLLITVCDGVKSQSTSNVSAAVAFVQAQALIQGNNGPALSIKVGIENSQEATVFITASDSNGVEFIGYRKAEDGNDKYTNKNGFSNITTAKQFTVDENDWYAVFATNTKGGYSYSLIEITNISDGEEIEFKTTPSSAGFTVTLNRTEIPGNKDKDKIVYDYVGWCKAKENAIYTSATEFKRNDEQIKVDDSTGVYSHTFTENGWYAICTVDADKKFSYQLIHVTDIGITSVEQTAVENAAAAAATETNFITFAANETKDNVQSNLTLPSEFTHNSLKYTITWASNNEAISDAGVVKRPTNDTEVTLTATFKHPTKSTATTTKAFKIKVKGTAAPTTYTVAFDSQSPTTPANPTSKTVTSPATTIDTLPTAPVKSGHTFGGWYTQINGQGTEFTATTAVTANITVYAKWTQNPTTTYTVSFNANGGSTVAAITGVASGAKISAPSAPTRDGHTFGGWYKEEACTNAWDFAADTVSSDITLYAKWAIKTFTVTFDSDGGSSVASQTVNYNETSTEPDEPTKADCTFAGWYKGESPWNFETAITENITLTAHWETPPTP